MRLQPTVEAWEQYSQPGDIPRPDTKADMDLYWMLKGMVDNRAGRGVGTAATSELPPPPPEESTLPSHPPTTAAEGQTWARPPQSAAPFDFLAPSAPHYGAVPAAQAPAQAPGSGPQVNAYPPAAPQGTIHPNRRPTNCSRGRRYLTGCAPSRVETNFAV